MPEGVRDRISVPWLILMVAMIAFIWGNSMIPGEGSSAISLTVLSGAIDWLELLGLPSAWLTHYLVRKIGHVTEYAMLAFIAHLAFRAELGGSCRGWCAAATTCLLVASLDETIQLVTPDRCGQVLDVFIDGIGVVGGLAFGALCALVGRLLFGRRPQQGE